jgi:hypothetical protein
MVSDLDNDGISDDIDNCPETINPGQSDSDSNGVGDACEIDSDSDGVMDSHDNCVFVYNPDQSDMENDRIGDVCDRCGVPGCHNPNAVSTCQELQDIRNAPTAEYMLVNDIDCTGFDFDGYGFMPIGTSISKFTGKLDGQGYNITGMYINRPSMNYVGLFGYILKQPIPPEIKNIGLKGVNITGSFYVGGLAGFVYGNVSNSYSTGSVSGIQYVGGLAGWCARTISSSYSTGSVSGSNSVGGLVGYDDGGRISNSSSTGSVRGIQFYVGGLVGYARVGAILSSYSTGNVSGGSESGGLVGYDNGAAISNSYSTVSVSGTNTLGGLVGYNYGTSVIISNCYATGNVSGSGTAGGLVGANNEGGTISNCYATGNVSGGINVGGLAGFSGGSNRATISNSYSTGNVSGSSRVGGLVGFNYGSYPGPIISNSFWDTETSGKTNCIGLGTPSSTCYGKTTAEMKTQSTFTDYGWDFATPGTWGICESVTYPWLQWRGSPCAPQDADGDGINDDVDNCPYNYNPDQLNIDGTEEGDVCDLCPACTGAGCCEVQASAGESVNSSGATISIEQDSVLEIPANALANDTSISITKGTGSNFEVCIPDAGDCGSVVSIYTMGPPGKLFNQYYTLKLAFDPDQYPECAEGACEIWYNDGTGWRNIFGIPEVQGNFLVIQGNHFTDFAIVRITCRDADNDGYGQAGLNSQCSHIGIDCNDNNSSINPGAVEKCNGIDDDCNGVIDNGCPSVETKATLNMLTQMLRLPGLDSTTKNEISKAIKDLNLSLGNLNAPNGDKDIIWLDSDTILCKHGFQVFDHQKAAVGHLKKITSLIAKPNATAAINSIVKMDRLLAKTAIEEAHALLLSGNTTIKQHDYDKAVESFNKGELETKQTNKIHYYRKAWKYVNKHCPFETRTCIESITLLSPKGELVSATGDEVSTLSTLETVFIDYVNDVQLKLQTGCTKCLKVGNLYGGWKVVEMIFKPGLEQTMANVCR